MAACTERQYGHPNHRPLVPYCEGRGVSASTDRESPAHGRSSCRRHLPLLVAVVPWPSGLLDPPCKHPASKTGGGGVPGSPVNVALVPILRYRHSQVNDPMRRPGSFSSYLCARAQRSSRTARECCHPCSYFHTTDAHSQDEGFRARNWASEPCEDEVTA